MTPRQLEIMQHALGVDKYGRGKNVGHGEFNRNYFAAGAADEPDCRELVAAGLMVEHRRTEVFRDYNCLVSEAGMQYVRDHSETPPKLSRSQIRYKRFLDADSGMKFGEWLKRQKSREASSGV